MALRTSTRSSREKTSSISASHAETRSKTRVPNKMKILLLVLRKWSPIWLIWHFHQMKKKKWPKILRSSKISTQVCQQQTHSMRVSQHVRKGRIPRLVLRKSNLPVLAKPSLNNSKSLRRKPIVEEILPRVSRQSKLSVRIKSLPIRGQEKLQWLLEKKPSEQAPKFLYLYDLYVL